MFGLYRLVVHAFLFGLRAARRILMLALRPMFGACGKGVIFNPFDLFSYSTIRIGNDVYIGSGAVFIASKSSIEIGDKVMFGPGVTIMGGDHNVNVVGKWMFDVKEKVPGNDLPVKIESDVWVGARAIILKGVTVGMGSVIAAGSVVTRSVPRNSIVAGVPARVIRQRFSDEDLLRHLQLLEQGKGRCAE